MKYFTKKIYLFQVNAILNKMIIIYTIVNN